MDSLTWAVDTKDLNSGDAWPVDFAFTRQWVFYVIGSEHEAISVREWQSHAWPPARRQWLSRDREVCWRCGSLQVGKARSERCGNICSQYSGRHLFSLAHRANGFRVEGDIQRFPTG